VRSATAFDEADVDLLLAEGHPDQIESSAQRHASVAISALVKKLLRGSSEAARVSAACEILDRGYGKPGVDIGGDAAMQLPLVMVPTAPLMSTEMRHEARKYANLAIEVLVRIANYGNSETAAVGASKALLNRALGTVGTARMPDEFRERPLGKKEMATRAAEAGAIGKYAVPAGPKNRRNDEPNDGGSMH
jgi:chemotaxis receptor (MCP) glutamine deamidase CheD